MIPRVAKFLKDEFPDMTSHTILLDGEPLLHTEGAKQTMADNNLRVLPDWPSHSPGLNPRENVWSWVKKDLRKAECKSDTFAVFKRRLIHSVHRFPGKAKLVPSMRERVRKCIQKKGYNIGM